jgi:hypothetical protein
VALKNIFIQIDLQPIGYHSALRFQQEEHRSWAIGKGLKVSLTFAYNDIRFGKNR